MIGQLSSSKMQNMNANEFSATLIPSVASNDMIPTYDTYDHSHLTSSHEGENLFAEDAGKYDLDTVSVFVAKLYQLLDGDEYKEYLTWNETGDVFVICNMDDFAANVLPKFFKHCKFTSFVRQLNIYGFYRVSDARKSKHVRSKHACVFSHPQFRRGRQDLLPNIRRKVSKTVRRRPRPEPSAQHEATVSPEPYDLMSTMKGSMVNKGNNVTSPGGVSINSLPHSQKEYSNSTDRSDNDHTMHDRIATLTHTTENLREEMKIMHRFVSDRLLPEVKNLQAELHKHHNHLLALTQYVTASDPNGNVILTNALRNLNKHSTSDMSDPQRSKRARLDASNDEASAGALIKSETPLSQSSIHYNLYAPISSNSHEHAHYKNEEMAEHQPQSNNALLASDPSLQTPTVGTSPMAISPDSHHSYNLAGSIMADFHHPQIPSDHSPTGYNGSWSTPTAVMLSDSVNTFNFLSSAPNHSPILYSQSAQQQASQHPPQNHSPQQQQQNQTPPQQQQPSPTPTIALSPNTSFVESAANTNDMLSANQNKANESHNTENNSSHQNHCREEIVGAPSPHSPVASPPSENNSLSNFYQQSSMVSLNMSMYGPPFGNYSAI